MNAAWGAVGEIAIVGLRDEIGQGRAKTVEALREENISDAYGSNFHSRDDRFEAITQIHLPSVVTTSRGCRWVTTGLY